jgi:hypothetical protein
MNNHKSNKNSGLRKLIEKGRALFHTRENIEHYSGKDYQKAEKKFVKFCVLEGRCGSLSG